MEDREGGGEEAGDWHLADGGEWEDAVAVDGEYDSSEIEEGGEDVESRCVGEELAERKKGGKWGELANV